MPEMMTKIRVFVDSSVLFAAIKSRRGYAFDLLRHAVRQEIVLVASPYVLEEVHGNLTKKSPTEAAVFSYLQDLLDFELVQPDSQDVEAVSQYVALKDAPVVAAAIEATVDYLATYDRKHLLDKPEVAVQSGLQIVTPDVIVEILRDASRQDESDI